MDRLLIIVMVSGLVACADIHQQPSRAGYGHVCYTQGATAQACELGHAEPENSPCSCGGVPGYVGH